MSPETIEFLKFILQFGVIPVIAGLWKLDRTINHLTVTIHKDFQTRFDAGKMMDHINEQLDKKANKRR